MSHRKENTLTSPRMMAGQAPDGTDAIRVVSDYMRANVGSWMNITIRQVI